MIKFIKEVDSVIYKDYKRKRVLRKGLYECSCDKEYELV